MLVVGCGNIAGAFDSRRPADALPLTHAGAFARHPGFELVACVEPDDARRSSFAARWGVPHAARSFAELATGGARFDVISICTPTAAHASDVDSALALRPRLIFCEKPVAPSSAQTERCIAGCVQAGVLLATNYTRRWDPEAIRIIESLRHGEWGEIRSVAATYNKGVLNNGSHLIDLLTWLLGPLEVLWAGTPLFDHWSDDPTLAAVLRSADGTIANVGVAHAADYSFFEMQIVTAGGVLAMENGGNAWRIRRVEESRMFAGYRSLSSAAPVAGKYEWAMTAAVANIHDALEGAGPLASTGANALDAQRTCEAIVAHATAPAPPVRFDPQVLGTHA